MKKYNMHIYDHVGTERWVREADPFNSNRENGPTDIAHNGYDYYHVVVGLGGYSRKYGPSSALGGGE